MGTLADIAAKYDYATATVEVASISATGNINPKAVTTTFENQQAIIKFTLLDKGNSDAAISATQLVVNDGTNSYAITPASATDEIYVAVPGFSEQTVTLTATVGGDTYTYEKSSVTFQNGKYYEITVKMTKQPRMLSNATSDDIGKVVDSDGIIYENATSATAAGSTAIAMIAYIGNFYRTSSKGIAIFLEDGPDQTFTFANNNNWETSPIVGTNRILPTLEDFNCMFVGCGAEGELVNSWRLYILDYSRLESKLIAAGGSGFKTDNYYWTSQTFQDYAYILQFNNEKGTVTELRTTYKTYKYHTRPCVVF